MLTCSVSWARAVFTKWMWGLKRVQSLRVSMEMLCAQVISEQLLTGACTPHGCWASCGKPSHRKDKINLTFPLDGGKNKSTSEPHGAPQQGHISLYHWLLHCYEVFPQ